VGDLLLLPQDDLLLLLTDGLGFLQLASQLEDYLFVFALLFLQAFDEGFGG
jgi:hypothetical protein